MTFRTRSTAVTAGLRRGSEGQCHSAHRRTQAKCLGDVDPGTDSSGSDQWNAGHSLALH